MNDWIGPVTRKILREVQSRQAATKKSDRMDAEQEREKRRREAQRAAELDRHYGGIQTPRRALTNPYGGPTMMGMHLTWYPMGCPASGPMIGALTHPTHWRRHVEHDDGDDVVTGMAIGAYLLSDGAS